jgi:hypothetical protein
MDRFNDSGRRPRPSPVRQRATRAAEGLLLITFGAILRLALTVGSPDILNVHALGDILILAGVVTLLLVPVSGRGRPQRRWLRIRWDSPGEPQPYSRAAPAASSGYDDGPAAADDLPALEFDPPPESAADEVGPV